MATLEAVVLVLIALSVVHSAVVFYTTLAKKLAELVLRLMGRRKPISDQEWPPHM